ncbi:MAG: DUF2867 domain-containing protein, partial [Bacteroidota bacterium]
MRILLTGATGYIGKNLLRRLLSEGHTVACCVRDRSRFQVPRGFESQVEVFQVDFVEMPETLRAEGKFDIAYYLIHSMSASTTSFEDLEAQAAHNFLKFVEGTGLQQVIYLSGIINKHSLSKHLSSRFRVEQILTEGQLAVTTLRAGIIVGAGGASFELIRDLVEKLPVMVTPKWLHTRCQPISIDNVLEFLSGVALKPQYYNQSYDIGGPDILTYKEMLEGYARVRGLPRRIFTVPVMTPRLSSYWLYFVTGVSYKLAVNLVDSMKVEVVCKPNQLASELGIELVHYEDSVRKTLRIYTAGGSISSWKDALSSSYAGPDLGRYQSVPVFGVLFNRQRIAITDNRQAVIDNIWSIGGRRGWYYGTWLWKIRGYMDKLAGGVGLRRGRRHDRELEPGDALDFWRVLAA